MREMKCPYILFFAIAEALRFNDVFYAHFLAFQDQENFVTSNFRTFPVLIKQEKLSFVNENKQQQLSCTVLFLLTSRNSNSK